MLNFCDVLPLERHSAVGFWEILCGCHGSIPGRRDNQFLELGKSCPHRVKREWRSSGRNLRFRMASCSEVRKRKTNAIWYHLYTGLPKWCSGKEFTCQWRRCRRRWFNPQVGRIPWSRKWHPIPVCLPGKIPWTEKSAGYSPWGHK